MYGKYEVTCRILTEFTVKVDANSEDEALEKVEAMYENGVDFYSDILEDQGNLEFETLHANKEDVENV